MAPKSGITLTEIDPAVLDTPAANKDTIFMDATLSPPFPAFMDSSRVVTSLQGPPGPAGPPASVNVATFGALSGDGSGGNPLQVNVDNETIGVDSTNKLEVIAHYIGASAPRTGLAYSGGHLDVLVDGVSIGVNASNELELLGIVPSSRQLWQYKAKTTATSGYPGNGYMLWDNATQISATNLLFSHLTTDDLDIDLFLSFLASTNTILIQDANDSANFQNWLVSGAPINTNPGTATSYWTAPVTLVSSGGTGTTGFANNHQLIAVIFAGAGANVSTAAVLTSGKTIIGAGGTAIDVSTLTGALVSSSAGTLAAVSVGTGLQIAGATLSANTDNETIGVDSNGKLEVIANYLLKGLIRQGLVFNSGWLDVNVDNETIGIDSQNKLQVIEPIPTRTRAITFAIDGGGAILTTGVKADVFVPYNCLIQAVTMLADQVGTVAVDVWAAPFGSYPPTVLNTITASAVPTINAAQSSQDGNLVGWTKQIAAGTTLRFNIQASPAPSAITRLNLTLTVQA